MRTVFFEKLNVNLSNIVPMGKNNIIFSTPKCNGYRQLPKEETQLSPELQTELLLQAVYCLPSF